MSQIKNNATFKVHACSSFLMKMKWCKISEWLEKLTGLDCLITRHEGYKKKYIQAQALARQVENYKLV